MQSDAIDSALEAQDSAALRVALLGAPLGVMVMPSPDDPTRLIPGVATAASGKRHVLVFTSDEARQAFGSSVSIETTSVEVIAEAALRNRVDSVLFNPSGPRATSALEPRLLQMILDGIDRPGDGASGVATLGAIAPASYDPSPVLVALASLSIEAAYAFDRVEGERRIPVLGLVASEDTMERAAGLLEGAIGIPVLDLMLLDVATAQAVSERLLSSRLALGTS